VPDLLERLCNRINDWDLTWVGVRALRPAPEQDMSGRVVAVLCLVYCPLSALIAFAIAYVYRNTARHVPESLPWVFAAAAAMLFLLLQCLLARAWNRRAARLRAKHGA
jgi:hypothetical protein